MKHNKNQAQQLAGSSVEKEVGWVQVALVVLLATPHHSGSLMQKQPQDGATCCSHTPLTIQEGCEKIRGI